jgi:hypothetical protein
MLSDVLATFHSSDHTDRTAQRFDLQTILPNVPAVSVDSFFIVVPVNCSSRIARYYEVGNTYNHKCYAIRNKIP